jgi:rare lipoprotein A
MKTFLRAGPALALVSLLLLLPACGRKAKPEMEQPGRRVEVGVASWYGREFQGRPTASGERFDMHDLTAAHRTLPFGTRVKVTNLQSGKSVVVRINDRGPHKPGRVIDLSYAAAKQLNLIEPGTARVRIEVLE